jgi:hypothetical protein
MFLKKNLGSLKELRQVKKVSTKRPSSDSISTIFGHLSETTVKKVREDEEKESDSESEDIELC